MTKYLNPVQFLTGIAIVCSFGSGLSGQTGPLLPQLKTRPWITSSTIPPNGDLNPYGVAFVPSGFPTNGIIQPGDVLVSNFNAGSSNQQGTGSTIVRVTHTGASSLFFEAPNQAGLTTALGVLSTGFVLVGHLPVTGSTIGRGSLIVIDRWGNLVENLVDTALLDGPWDLTVVENGNSAHVFVSNVLSGAVTRLDFNAGGAGQLRLVSSTQIASRYTHRLDPAALVIGPTGLAYDAAADVLYVASAGDNAIYAVPSAKFRTTDAGTGSPVYWDSTRLHGPLGLLLAPNGDLITANGDAVNPGGKPNELVEFTKAGVFVAQYQVDSGAGGAAFGIAVESLATEIRFAAIDDNTNSVTVWRMIH